MKSKMLKAYAILSLLLFLGVPGLSVAAEKPRVAILPLALNGPDNLGYLKDGIRAMLGSRLAAGAGVSIVDQAEVNDAIKRLGAGAAIGAVGNELKVDLVLSGSITSLGEGLSIDLKGIRPAGQDAVEGFFASAVDQAAVIGAVDQLAGDIAARMYGKNTAPVQKRPVAAAGDNGGGAALPSAGAAVTANVTPDQSLHPDRLFVAEMNPVVPMEQLAAPPVAVGIHQPSPSGTYSGMVQRSQDMDMEIQDFDSGDLYGDGTEQLVVAEKHKIHIYRQDGNRVQKSGMLPALPKFVKVVSISVADVNKNGRAEVYVSTNSDNSAQAYAYEWNGSGFEPIFEKESWYVKTMQVKDDLFLLGQKSDFDIPYSPGVYKLQVKNGKIEADEKLALPDGVNIFDFIMADFTGDGQLEVAAVDQDDDLTLFEHTGDALWQSDGSNFGYTVRFVGKASGTISDERKTYNVPTRLVASDLNGDGRAELLVMKNPSGLSTLLKTIGSYTGGGIELKSWNGISFVDVWSTGKIGSYIAEFQQTKDVKSGKNILRVAIIMKKSGKLLKKNSSVIATYILPNFSK